MPGAPSKRRRGRRELAGIEVLGLVLSNCASGFSREGVTVLPRAKRACGVRQKHMKRMVIGMDRQKTSTFVNMIRRLVMGLKALILKEQTTKGIDAKEDPARGRLPAIITYLRHNYEQSKIPENQLASTFVNFIWPADHTPGSLVTSSLPVPEGGLRRLCLFRARREPCNCLLLFHRQVSRLIDPAGCGRSAWRDQGSFSPPWKNDRVRWGCNLSRVGRG